MVTFTTLCRNCLLAIVITSVFVLRSYVSSGQCQLDKSNWTLYWSQEFNGSGASSVIGNGMILSPTSWVKYDSNNGCNVHKENMLDVKEGCGYFYAKAVDYNISTTDPKWPVAHVISESADLETNVDEMPDLKSGPNGSGFMYGIFEIRCKLPHNPIQASPAFWLHGNMWPPEIDAFEYHAGDQYFSSSIHYNALPGTPSHIGYGNNYEFSNVDFWNEFHTWTIVWTPDQVTWFFDNKELKTDTELFHQPNAELWLVPPVGTPSPWGPHAGGFITWVKSVIDVGTGIAWGGSTGFTDPLIVDYIRVYKPNGYEPFYWIDPSTGLRTRWADPDDWYYNTCLSLYRSTSYKSTSDWVTNVIVPGTITPDFVDNNLKGFLAGGGFLYKGANNSLWATLYSGPGFYNYQMGSNNSMDGDLALAYDGFLSYYRKSNSVKYQYLSSFYTVPGITDAAGKIVANNSNGDFWYVAQNGSNLGLNLAVNNGSNSYTISSVLSSGYGSDLIVNPNDFSEVFYITAAHNLASIQFYGGTWWTSTLTASGTVLSDLAISPTGNELFYKSTGNTLFSTTRISGTNPTMVQWNTPQGYYATTAGTTTPALINNVRGNILVTPDSSNPYPIWVGTDNKPWGVYLSSSGLVSTWFDWNSNNVKSDLSIILDPSNPTKTHLCWIDNNDKIRTLEYLTPCEVLNPDSNNNFHPFQMKTAYITPRFNSSTTKYIGHVEAEIYRHPINSPLLGGYDDIILYPNPSSDIFHIKNNSITEQRIKYELINVAGNIIVKWELTSNAENTLDLKLEPIAVYYLKVISGSGVKTFKLIKA